MGRPKKARFCETLSIQLIDHLYSPPLLKVHYGRAMYSFCKMKNRYHIHSFIHSGHFYSAPSSPLLLRGAPDYSMYTVSEFHATVHRELRVKDLPKVPTWRLERESNPRPSG